MKDVQGIQRGKCNSCECIEYRAPEESCKYSCEYCGHRPVEHVRIVELGGCRSKGCDCDKYSSDDPNSYTDCQYCGCNASLHKGADALRKPKPAPSQPATVPVSAVTGGYVMSGHPGSGGQATMMGSQQAAMMQQYTQTGQSGIQPRISATGVPVQSMAHGTCSFPGCSFPRRVEGDKVHDYCSKTCAQKHSQLTSSFHQQKLTSAKQAAKSGPPPASMATFPALSPTQAQMCKNCNQQPANPGRGWCENCFRKQKP